MTKSRLLAGETPYRDLVGGRVGREMPGSGSDDGAGSVGGGWDWGVGGSSALREFSRNEGKLRGTETKRGIRITLRLGRGLKRGMHARSDVRLEWKAAPQSDSS